MLIFRQLFDCESCTYTYLIGDSSTGQAAIIDPVAEQLERDSQIISDLGLKLAYALDTHVHADHVTSLGPLRERFACRTGMSAKGGAACADMQLKEGDRLALGAHVLQVIETPGHTDGCLTYSLGDRIFTGDCLFVRGCGRTDFQCGNAGRLFDSVTRKLFRMPDTTLVYPGHDYRGHTVSTIGEEKRLNPRLTKSRDEFIAFMNDLKLPDPKKMMEAVPRNLKCGERATA